MKEQLSELLPAILSFLVVGGVIGLLCRKHIFIALLLTIPASIGWWMLGAWYAGTFSDQFSLQDPWGTLFGTGVLYLYFGFPPSVLAALIITTIWRIRSKRVERSHERSTS